MLKKNRWYLSGVAIPSILAFQAQAIEITTAIPDLNMRWDNTLKYSINSRLKPPSSKLTEGPDALNTDDGDRNFSRGLISNRLDIYSEFDVKYKNVGMRVSGAGWYDTVYNKSNNNNSPETSNSLSVQHDHFTSNTEELHGRKTEILDAFVFGATYLGDTRLTGRLGSYALQWGEGLFFGDNGIAAAQSPVDAVKAYSLPGTQFKELIRPVPQISAQLQVTPDLSFGAYYQFHWEETRLPAAGSYFSTSDSIGDGAERIFLAGGPVYLKRRNDMQAKDSGQGGMQMKFRLDETDFGVYAVRYHAKTPQAYGNFSETNYAVGQIGTYQWAYPEDITAFGASVSHSIDVWNFAAEISARHNMPLSSDLQDNSFGLGDNSSNPLYAVGNTLHANFSWLAYFGPSFISQEADFIGEVAFNRVLNVTNNREALSANADRDAYNLRLSYAPMYRQVYSGLDVSVPVGFGLGISNSTTVDSFLGDKVGDVNFGLKMTYLNDWRIGVNYTHFFGPVGNYLENGSVSFKQAMKDRDFLSISLQHSF